MPVDMSYSEFLETLKNEIPYKDWPEALKSMWYDAKGNWKASHDIAEKLNGSLGSWIHAYLHRKEGDDWNARYWYRQAGKSFPITTLEEEHQEIVEFILNQ